MFADKTEENFFLSHLCQNHNVLEYGSGESTLQISNIVKSIVSIEHQLSWYEIINNKSLNNCRAFFVPPDMPYEEGKHCGTYEEFYNYIHKPIEYGPYDIILIDGRARVECAKICKNMSHINTMIFVHDWHRKEYHEICEYLKLIEVQNTMAKFVL